MIATIREEGFIPFFRCAFPGWSIEERTAPGHWFGKEEDGGSLGPWDWKIDAVRSGDIAYGKYLRRKAVFATRHWYGHLSNWRRSLPYYRMAVGGSYDPACIDERLMKYVAPTVLGALKENGALESSAIRSVISDSIPLQVREKVGGHMAKYLIPDVKKQAVDFVLQYLEMGTWAVTGDFTRVYRGPNLEYSGWQRASITTPEALFGDMNDTDRQQPFWARFIDGGAPGFLPDCSPEESLEALVSHIRSRHPEISREALVREFHR